MLLGLIPRRIGRAPGPVAELVRLCRPRQWAKNVFVLAPAVFGGGLAIPAGVGRALAATACFCLASSAVYVVNDLLDAAADRSHPRKKARPLAAGAVSPGAARIVAVILAIAAAGLAGAALPASFLLFLGLYAANSLVYCVWLKHRVLADVLLIAVGFVLRLLGGSAAVGVEASSWLIACGFALALVLGFGKRRLEVAALPAGTAYRTSLANYTPARLDALLAINIAVCLLTYLLYTVAPDTVARHGTRNLVYTVPLVAYGLFRYLFKVQEGGGDDPADVLLADPVFLLNGLLWVLAVLAVLTLG
jgi:4-hydroxybenzoate polyprenyltransferase